jgi:hypothetical protein
VRAVQRLKQPIANHAVLDAPITRAAVGTLHIRFLHAGINAWNRKMANSNWATAVFNLGHEARKQACTRLRTRTRSERAWDFPSAIRDQGPILSPCVRAVGMVPRRGCGAKTASKFNTFTRRRNGAPGTTRTSAPQIRSLTLGECGWRSAVSLALAINQRSQWSHLGLSQTSAHGGSYVVAKAFHQIRRFLLTV